MYLSTAARKAEGIPIPMNISWQTESKNKPQELDLTHLHFGGSTLVPYEQQVALAVDEDFLLEAAALGRLLLHVGAGKVSVHQGRLSRVQRADDSQPQIGNGARDRPFLAVHKRIWKRTSIASLLVKEFLS